MFTRTQSEKSMAHSVESRTEQRSISSQDASAYYTNGSHHEAVFKVDTFEYRLLREAEFREAVTHRTQVKETIDL